ncbi:MAG: fumarylacetoacetate hydrolase family protein [Chloroflexi bacterium]|nr:fumarylacetoacetate hydrolase family protein [Chloroflexota bacterium]
MALVISYLTPDGPRYGLVDEGIVFEWEGDLLVDRQYNPGHAVGTPESVTLLPPVRPSKIVCIGRNYAAHAAEHNAAVPDEPIIFLKPPSALIGPQVAIEFAHSVGRVDHEAELAVIIGKQAHKVSRESALDYVIGYTCANDVSARDLQKKDGQWARAKGFDTFCPLGPYVNTDLNPADLGIRCTVNGQLRQDSRTSMLVFDVPALIAFISQVMTLLPGDLILTGTPEGVSQLFDGDVVRVEIEGIGTLENPVKVVS